MVPPTSLLVLMVFFFCSGQALSSPLLPEDPPVFKLNLTLASDDLPLDSITSLLAGDSTVLSKLPPARGDFAWTQLRLLQNSTDASSGSWSRQSLQVTEGTLVISHGALAFLHEQSDGTTGVFPLRVVASIYSYRAERIQGSFPLRLPFPNYLALSFDTITGLDLTTYDLSGTAIASGPGNQSIYARLYSRSCGYPSGQGFSLNAAFQAKFTPWLAGSLEVDHLAGQILWHDLPYEDYYFNTDAWEGLNGNYGPLMHGWVGNEDWVMYLEPSFSGELRFTPRTIPTTLALTWHPWAEEPGFKIAWHPHPLLVFEAGAAFTRGENYPLYSLASSLEWHSLHLSLFAAGYSQMITGAGLSAAYTLSW